MRIAVGDTSNDWQQHTYGNGSWFDFEAVTNPGGGTLLIGVEGSSKDGSCAHVRQLDPSSNASSKIGTFTNNVWKLGHCKTKAGDGMEAFTFIPAGSCPASWGQPTGDFKGFFLAAYQSRPGQADVYDLPGAQNSSLSAIPANYITTITVDSPDPAGYPNGLKISDFFFCPAADRLFVLYDDAVSMLQQCILSSSRAASVFAAQTPVAGCEAVMVTGSSLYVGLDQNKAQLLRNGYTANYVFEYPDFTGR